MSTEKMREEYNAWYAKKIGVLGTRQHKEWFVPWYASRAAIETRPAPQGHRETDACTVTDHGMAIKALQELDDGYWETINHVDFEGDWGLVLICNDLEKSNEICAKIVELGGTPQIRDTEPYGHFKPCHQDDEPEAVAKSCGDSVDLRLLLNKYIEHVFQCEGSDFIGCIDEKHHGSDVPFSAAELAELVRLQKYPLKF